MVSALRAGARLRIGWYHPDENGEPVVVHWVDGSFLTQRGTHVFAQFGSIHTQVPHRDAPSLELSEQKGSWTGMVGTDGVLQGRFGQGSVARRTVPMMWCESPESYLDRCRAEWRVLYRNDGKGERLAGSKRALLDAVERGQPLRVAWGGKRGAYQWAHSSEPIWVNKMADSELVVELPEHHALRSYHDPAKTGLADSATLWRGSLSTTGQFDAVLVNRGTGQIEQRLPQRAAVTWMAWTPPAECLPELPDLEVEVEGGVVRDTSSPDP
ncbi:MAG: hypothetical protein ACFB9M_21380 [Myxococcota bacterium]